MEFTQAQRNATWPTQSHDAEQSLLKPWNQVLESTEQKTCQKCRHSVALFLRLSSIPPERRKSARNQHSHDNTQGELEERSCQHGCCELHVRNAYHADSALRVYYHVPVSDLSEDWEQCWLCTRMFTMKRSSQVLQVEHPTYSTYRNLEPGTILRYRIGEQKGLGAASRVVMYGSVKLASGIILETDRITFVDTPKTERRYIGRNIGDLAFRTVSVTDAPLPAHSPADLMDQGATSVDGQKSLQVPMLAHNRLSMIRQWKEQCNTLHPVCRVETISNEFLPRRLVHIGSSPDQIRLMYPPPSRSEVQYATLSHCWGREPFTKLTHANHDKFCTQIPQEDLAKTFAEAISLCRLLDIAYVWIDSFCIIQDSPSDWAEQAPQMGSIYAGSVLNISAAASTDPTQGLFRDYNPKVVERLRLLSTCGSKDLLEHSDHELASDYSTQSLYKRSWVAQERWLAARELSFTGSQLVWYCKKALHLEREPGKNIIHSQHHAVLRAPDKPDAMSIAQAWAQMIALYSPTRATFSRDRVVALANLAAVYEQLYARIGAPNRYLVGLWEANLGTWIRWSPVSCTSTWLAKHPIAPSWSWLSVFGKVKVVPLAPSKPSVWQLAVLDYLPIPLDPAVPTGALQAKLVVQARWFHLAMSVAENRGAGGNGDGSGEEDLVSGGLRRGEVTVKFKCYGKCWAKQDCITTLTRFRKWSGVMRIGSDKGELLEATASARVLVTPDRQGPVAVGEADYWLLATDVFCGKRSGKYDVRGIICEPVEAAHDDESVGSGSWKRRGVWESTGLLSQESYSTWSSRLERVVLE